MENPQHKCFICDKPIKDEDLSIDHVIPWSYLYSDDLWNLVYVDKSCNSSKSNHIPEEFEIRKLENRNKRLLQILLKNGFHDKTVHDLQMAIEKNYVEKFWIGCQ